MYTHPPTFHLFSSLPTELQLHILSLATSPSPPSADDVEIYECDPPAARISLTAVFLRAKIEQWLDGWEGVSYGGGEMDPLSPYILLLSSTTVRAQFYMRETQLFADRKALLWASRGSRMVALEAWEGEVRGLKVSGVRSSFGDGEMEMAKGRFVEILDELLVDVRGTLRQEGSRLRELWRRQVENLKKREEDEYAEIEVED